MKAGADVNVVIANDLWENTALITAVRKGCTECVKILIKAGADVNRRNLSGNIPMISAAKRGDEKMH